MKIAMQIAVRRCYGNSYSILEMRSILLHCKF